MENSRTTNLRINYYFQLQYIRNNSDDIQLLLQLLYSDANRITSKKQNNDNRIKIISESDASLHKYLSLQHRLGENSQFQNALG